MQSVVSRACQKSRRIACVVNVGDPLDRTLRKVEKEVVIPKMMTAKAKELCHKEVRGKMLEVK